MTRTSTSMNYIILVTVMLCASFASSRTQAQRKKPTPKPRSNPSAPQQPKPPPQAVAPKPPILDVSELKAPKVYGYLFDGRFERLEDYEIPSKVIFISYVESFSANCQSFLPNDKEELTKIIETYGTQMNYLYGRRGIVAAYPTRTLEDRRTVGTGIYAAPAFASAFRRIIASLELIITRQFLANLTEGKVQIYPEEFIRISQQAPEDVKLLLTRNGCNSAATKRLGENLLRFASGEPSVQQQNGEASFFEKECRTKLPGILAGTTADSCKCVHKEFKKALHTKDLFNLEDNFDSETFLLTSFSQVGLQQTISACLSR